jgi:hypothetical protein
MNRIVLIGNGFDVAHGLNTKYEHFIDWYWDQRLHNIVSERSAESKDILCSLKILSNSDFNSWASLSFQNSYFKTYNNEWKLSGKEFINELRDKPDCFEVSCSPFFDNICKSIKTKKWVDIENEYYRLLTEYALDNYSEENIISLNKQLHFLQEVLIDYLNIENQQDISINDKVRKKIYAPIKLDDISVSAKNILKENVDSWVEQNELIVQDKILRYGYSKICFTDVSEFCKKYKEGKARFTDVPFSYMLPDAVMLLSFNYTKTSQLYHNDDLGFIDYIHGRVEEPQSIIFGYGDEIDENYKRLKKLGNNDCLNNVKTIKYLESDNYKRLLSFAESAPFQVYIMGHSCGNSDRTLLNTLFEHKNCISIKPYYYIKDNGTDNYIELIQNISRNFTDMKLMRDRVVNKTYCEPLTK